jgi:general secretion pathway protein B
MSFILDALKKSENARQRQIGPAVAELPRRRYQTERPWWAFVVAGLLLVNIGVLILVLARNRDRIEPVTTAAAAPLVAGNMGMASRQSPPESTTVLPARDSRATRFEPEPAPGRTGDLSSLADEAAIPLELAAESAGSAQTELPAPAAVRPIQAPAVAPLARTAPAPAAPAARAESQEILPTIDELAAAGRTFPALRLDIHVFGDTPAERFVFVNMRKYSEGQALQEGPTIERITDDGVILNQQGLRFVLQRQ